MGRLRGRLGRVIGARSGFVCSVLLASTLLAGCNGTSAAGSTGSAASASGSSGQSVSSSPSPTTKSVDVSWTPPTTNTNGSALTDLAGYRIYYGTSPDTLDKTVDVPNAGAVDYVFQGLGQGTWYFAVKAYTNTGLESALSSVANKTVS